MQQGSRHLFLAILLAFGLLSTGCAGGWLSNHAPWGQKKESEIPGIKTADQRIVELKQLAEKAKEKSPDEQQKISEKLARQIEKETDPLVRAEIVTTLASYPTPLAAKIMVAALSDPEGSVRIICCTAWGKRGGREAAERLTGALSNDTNVDVKLAAARALAKVKDSSALPILADTLADADPALQHRAIESMKTISGRDFGSDVNAWRQFAKTGQGTDTQTAGKSWWRKFF